MTAGAAAAVRGNNTGTGPFSLSPPGESLTGYFMDAFSILIANRHPTVKIQGQKDNSENLLQPHLQQGTLN